MRATLAPLRLVAARVRRRPGLWLWPALGITLATAFAAAVAVEGVLAGDRAARGVLDRLAPAERVVRVTWQGPLRAAQARRVAAALRRLPIGARTRVLVMDPVRLRGVVVRPAAIAPLDRWLAGRGAAPGPCRADRCPMLLAGPGHVPAELTAPGVRIQVTGPAPINSAVPLGFVPAGSASPPVLLTSDVAGLNALPGLGGIYRTSTTLAPLRTGEERSWQLAGLEGVLARSQAAVGQIGTQFSLSGPFAGLDAARAQARAAPRRLLLAGGAAISVLALFVVLIGGALRRDQLEELARLRNAGARAGQSAVFVVAECAWVSATGLLAGVGIGIAASALLANAAGAPVGEVLGHSLITWQGAVALAAGWLAATLLLAGAVLIRSARVLDAIALAAAAALIAAVALSPGGGDAPALLLAPLCCLAAGVVVFRGAEAALRAGERLARRGPLVVRLALVGLARAPGLPSLAIAFVAVSVGLGGFALAYRATLIRGSADQAADRVPLDAIVAAGPDFKTPSETAPPARWQTLARGTVAPVRRTQANYLSGSGTVTVPALGIPTAAIDRLHGWRTSDGSAPLPALANRLRPAGRVRNPGPTVPVGAGSLALRAYSPALAVSLTADLRSPDGAIRQLPLGVAGSRPHLLSARLPEGRWEVAALELDEPGGLDITNGHQNGENIAAATQERVRLRLGPLVFAGGPGRPAIDVGLGAWRGVGAASGSGANAGAGAATIGFDTTGAAGIVRPAQPSDVRPVPVLADPRTAAAATSGGLLALTVDGLPVRARVVGTIRRFPTVGAAAGGVVVADEATLAGALDAELPGQGRPDELWIATSHPGSLRRALGRPPLDQLNSTFSSAVERQLSSAPIGRGVERTLLAAALLWAVLAVLGLLTALIGPGRDRSIELDLEAQGVGPRALRREARARIGVAGLLGVGCGLVIAVILTPLAVSGVRAAATLSAPEPPLVTIVPVAELVVWAAVVLAGLAGAGWLWTRRIGAGPRTQPVRPSALAGPEGKLTQGVAR